MTWEEAITRTEEVIKFLKDQGWDVFDQTSLTILALKMVLTALRPVSRERVEKVWRGKWNVSYDELNGFTYVTCSKCGDETVLNGCFVTTEGEPCGLEDFCPACGAPMTDEAVDIRLKELEALNDGKGD